MSAKARDGVFQEFAPAEEEGQALNGVSGSHPLNYVCTQPYNVRKLGIQDLDGHDIGFGQVLP